MIDYLEYTKQMLKVKSSTAYIDNVKLNNFDPGILDLVVVLNHLGFSTYSSCQGHPEEDSSYNYTPYIMFCEPAMQNITNYDIKKEYQFIISREYHTSILEQARLIKYLNEFYSNRETEYAHSLTIENNIFSRFTLSFPISLLNIEDKGERIKVNKILLKEIDDFTEFLKTKI